MNKLLATASVLALISLVSQANAANEERWPRWYLGLSGGVAFLPDTDIKGGTTGNVDYKMGGVGTASLGYMPAIAGQPFSNMRLEFEAGYHSNRLDGATVSGSPVATHGRLLAFSYMGNVYYDFRNTSPWTPYVGAGAGGARVSLSKRSGLGNTDSSDNVFAWQLMTGLAYAPTSMPMTEWSVGYRFFDMSDPSFHTASASAKLENPMAHNVELGARFRF